MEKKKQNENRKNDFSKIEKEKVSLWMRHGIEDVYFQRDALVNFWTILGGIAVAALLTQTNYLIEKILLGQWYLSLYYLTSIMLIVLSWVQNLWGSIILRIPVTILHTFLVLMNLLFLSILCLQVTNPAIFFLAAGCSVMFALLLQVYLMRSGAWTGLSKERIKDIYSSRRVYLVFMCLCFLAAAHLYYYSSIIAEAGWGFFAVAASTGAMTMQHFIMKQERKEVGVP